MKKSIAVLALALALTGSLAACSNRDPNANNTTGSGTTSGSGAVSGTTSGSAGQVARRYDNQSVYNGRIYDGRTYAGQVSRRYNTTMNQGRDYFYGRQNYMDDGRYTAGSNGQVYSRDGSTVSRDLTRGARDIVRDTEDVLDDVGRGIGNAARDITGNSSYSGTPSWEPDSSAVRY